jgi:hypothetical protein
MAKDEVKTGKNWLWVGFQFGFGFFVAMLAGFIILGALTSLIWLFVR